MSPFQFASQKEDRKKIKEGMKDLAVGKESSFEMNILRKDGSFFTSEVSATMVKEDGRIFFFGITFDISQREKALTDLKKSEKVDFLPI